MLTCSPLINEPPEAAPNVFGDFLEGSNESEIDPVGDLVITYDISDCEGGTFNFALDLDNDGTFGESGEPQWLNVDLAAEVPTQWEVKLDWSDFVALFPLDPPSTQGSPSFEFHVEARELIEGNFVQVNEDFTVVNLQNSMPFFDAGSIGAAPSGGGSGCSGGNSHVIAEGTFTEYGIGDTVTLQIDWGDGTIDVYADFLEGLSNDDRLLPFSFDHDYDEEGHFDITFTVFDDEGGPDSVSEFNGSQFVYTELEDIVLGGPSGPSVCLDGDVLTVTGSDGNDTVTITQPTGQIHVVSSFFPTQDFAASSVANIVVQLGDGNDVLLATANKPMVAVGGGGADAITGGPARSILIGGAGADLLAGGSAQDILVDGATIHDDDIVALLAMLAEWNSGHSFQDRVANLINGSGSVQGLNETTEGSYFLTPAGNDLAIDILIGGGSTDWISRHSGDLILGLFDFVT